jgi:ATP-dependent Zn protease
MQIKNLKLFTSIVFCLFLTNAQAQVQTDTEKLASLIVSDSQFKINIDAKERAPTLFALVNVKNSSDASAYNIVLEAKFLDSANKVVDVITQENYGIVVPAGKDVLLKLRDSISGAQASYSKVEVRVLSADFRAPKSASGSANPNNTKNAMIEFLISWGPMLLLIAVWIYMMRKYSNGYQNKVLQFMDKQNELIAKQAAALEQIATASSASKSKE